MVCGVQVGNEPVKYLGVFLGMGDLTALNFEACLLKAYKVAQRWSKHPLTLLAKIVVLKTFIFSVFRGGYENVTCQKCCTWLMHEIDAPSYN